MVRVSPPRRVPGSALPRGEADAAVCDGAAEGATGGVRGGGAGAGSDGAGRELHVQRVLCRHMQGHEQRQT